MYKIKIGLILVLIACISTATYCAFTVSVEKTGSIETTELSTKFVDNSTLLTKVQVLDSSITSINKENDLTRYTEIPTINLSNDNIVSTDDSNVPIYLWIDNGTIYYFTVATTIDINNN